MELVTLFKDFGFPALMVGVLLWMYVSKLEKLTITINEIKNKLDHLCDDVKEIKDDE